MRRISTEDSNCLGHLLNNFSSIPKIFSRAAAEIGTAPAPTTGTAVEVY